IPHIRRLLEALCIPVLEFVRYEADDVIGAIARRDHNQPLEVVIVSSDKDMLQLVNERVFMLNPMKDDEWYDAAKVEQFMGVKPSQVADLLALKGDAIDNIPGAPGIGDKGARDLIARFGSVEAALDRAAEVERKMYRESLQTHRDQVLLSKRLATIDTQLPLEWSLDSLRAQPSDTTMLKAIYRELEFFSLLKDLAPEDDKEKRDYAVFSEGDDLSAWLEQRPPDAPLAIALDPANSFFGLSYRAGQGRAAPLDLLHRMGPLLLSDSVPILVHDAKAFLRAAESLGLPRAHIAEDAMLYAFLLCADPGACSPETLAERYLNRKLNPAIEQQAEATLATVEILRPELQAQELACVYREIDLPLVPVLARMESTGIRVD
ncbi:MAG: 5'-3' exonuclease H3TH domain-containing protein, partial [Bryobacteraceae bacterium]